MLKYKKQYKVYKEPNSNPDDSYLQSKYGQIYRYSLGILIIWLKVKSNKLIVPNRIAQLIKDTGIEILEEFIDDESVELRINESDLDKVIDIMKIRRKKEKQFMDKNSQEYQKLMERLKR
jgi:ribosomal protein L21